MSSTYSDRLKLELMATGANANTWGNNTNTNLNVLDAFSAGYLSKSVAGSSDVTLTTNNADPTAEASNKVIEFTGALTGDIKVFVPAVESNYIFFNNTTGSQTLTVAPTGHTSNGVAITQGAHTIMYNKGNKMVDLFAGSLGVVGVKGAATFNEDVNVATGKKIVTENITLNSNGVVAATSYTGSGAALTGIDPFPSTTSMVFNQASAPTGWTKQTASALANTAMSIVTGTGGGTGGADSFFDTFTGTKNTDLTSATVSVSGTIGGHSLSTPEISSHSHPGPKSGTPGGGGSGLKPGADNPGPNPTGSAGGGGTHTQPFTVGSSSLGGTISVPNMNVQYANVIIANKD